MTWRKRTPRAHAEARLPASSSSSLAMALKQTSILAPRFCLSTPKGSRLSRRTIISSKRSTSSSRKKIVQMRRSAPRTILRQLDFKQFLMQPRASSRPSTPELIAEDQEILAELHDEYLRHKHTLSHYLQACSPRTRAAKRALLREIFGEDSEDEEE